MTPNPREGKLNYNLHLQLCQMTSVLLVLLYTIVVLINIWMSFYYYTLFYLNKNAVT